MDLAEFPKFATMVTKREYINVFFKHEMADYY